MDFRIFEGDTDLFAIEINVSLQSSPRWIYGTLFFWLEGTRIGDPYDSVDLRGATNWLRDFSKEKKKFEESKLFYLSLDSAFEVLMSRYVGYEVPEIARGIERISRFSIDYLGMSSFNTTPLFLVANNVGLQRCIWKEKGGGICQAFYDSPVMQEVASKVVSKFEGEFGYGC